MDLNPGTTGAKEVLKSTAVDIASGCKGTGPTLGWVRSLVLQKLFYGWGLWGQGDYGAMGTRSSPDLGATGVNL